MKIVIRRTRHEKKEMIGTCALVLNPGRHKLNEIKSYLNAFFASENLPYVALIEEN